jgi:hypothetical protein
MQYHSERSFSKSMIDFKVNNTITDSLQNNDKLKAHGNLILICK